MKLLEYLEISENDFDTFDTEYDGCVTVCYLDEYHDNYDFFCKKLYEKVEVKKVSGCELTVNWSELIERNMDKFKEFTKKHWRYFYEDKDEFIYQWIREIHYYLAGYVDEDFYITLNKFLDEIN